MGETFFANYTQDFRKIMMKENKDLGIEGINLKYTKNHLVPNIIINLKMFQIQEQPWRLSFGCFSVEKFLLDILRILLSGSSEIARNSLFRNLVYPITTERLQYSEQRS